LGQLYRVRNIAVVPVGFVGRESRTRPSTRTSSRASPMDAPQPRRPYGPKPASNAGQLLPQARRQAHLRRLSRCSSPTPTTRRTSLPICSSGTFDRDQGESGNLRCTGAAVLSRRGLRDRQGLRRGRPRLQIKPRMRPLQTCDIKDPCKNINWVVAQGGGATFQYCMV